MLPFKTKMCPIVLLTLTKNIRQSDYAIDNFCKCTKEEKSRRKKEETWEVFQVCILLISWAIFFKFDMQSPSYVGQHLRSKFHLFKQKITELQISRNLYIVLCINILMLIACTLGRKTHYHVSRWFVIENKCFKVQMYAYTVSHSPAVGAHLVFWYCFPNSICFVYLLAFSYLHEQTIKAVTAAYTKIKPKQSLFYS